MKNSKNRAILGSALAASLLQSAVFAGDSKAILSEAAPADLPNVLIIGDSISMGYTEGVKGLLKDKANVFRPPVNCAHSGNGVQNVKSWVGTQKWEVIHFNFGIWDTHLLYNGAIASDRSKHKAEDLKRRYTTEEYIENLRQIVAILKKTGSTLIWSSTTPYVSYGEDTKRLLEKNNKAAEALMKTEGVMVNDLYNLALPNLKEWQTGDGCHFNALGYSELSRQVAANISDALSKKVRKARPSNGEK